MPSTGSIHEKLPLTSYRDNDLNYQRAANSLADSLRSLIDWSSFGNPLAYYHPIRPLAIKYYSGIMDRYVTNALHQRLLETQRSSAEESESGSRSAISLVLWQNPFQFKDLLFTKPV